MIAAAAVRVALLALYLAAAAFDAHARPYAAKPVRFVVPCPPGGSNDVLSRVVRKEIARGRNVARDANIQPE